MARRFSVEAVFNGVDRLTKPITRMQNSVGKFTRSLERGLRSASRKLGVLIGGFWRGAKTVAKFGIAIFAAVGAATVIAVNKLADAADKLAKQSARLQFPIEELQQWRFVAEQSGVSVELLDTSLDSFTNRLGQLRGGMGQLVSGLRKIDNELLRQLSTTDSVADAFELFINAIADTDSATKKAAIAYAGFGKAGLKLVSIADSGAAAIKRLRLEQIENGIITKEQAENAEAYNDSVNSLKRTIIGTIQQALLPVLPVLTELAKKFRMFILNNKELLKLKIQDFFIKIGTALENLGTKIAAYNRENNLFDNLVKTIQAMVNFIKFLSDNSRAIVKWGAVIIGLSIALKALAVVIGIVNLVMSLNPVAAIILAFIALVAAVISLIKWFSKLNSNFKATSNTGVGHFGAIINKFNVLISRIKLGIRWLGKLATSFKSLIPDFDIFSRLGGFFSRSSDDNAATSEAPAAHSVLSPQDRVSRQIIESTNNTNSQAELTIRDDTGRTEVTKGPIPHGIFLQSSGAF